MSRRLTAVFAMALGAALIVPIPAFAAVEQPATGDPGAGTSTFDTPAPTRAPVTGPDGTPRPRPSPKPTDAPIAAFDPPAPERSDLQVGYTGSSVLAQAPLLLAEEAGFFDEVGLTEITIKSRKDVLDKVRSGALDIGVVDAAAAFAAFKSDPSLHAIAGYRNYEDKKGAYRGDVLLATPRLVADEPATALAFLAAYIRALQLLGDDDGAGDAYALIKGTDLAFNVKKSDWADALSIYEPFDGGFGSLDDEDGLGELVRHLARTTDAELDVEAFIDEHTLNIAQTWEGLGANPASDLVSAPGIAEITVGLPAGGSELSPVTVALEAGYFSDAGFTSVDVVEVEEPLLGVLQGKVDFGTMDTLDTAEAARQGLPLTTLAGHRNYSGDGAYGGDVLIAATDLVAGEGSTVSAFLIAYNRGLRELADDAAFAAHDGGFGDRARGGGLGELSGYLGIPLEPDGDLDRLRDGRALEYAQAWLGLPANPTEPASVAEEDE